MKTKHTPGPWTYSEYRKGGFHRIRINAKDGDLEYSVGAAAVKFVSRNEALANARLFAAAPDMLAALESAMRALNTAPRFRIDANKDGIGGTDSYKIAAVVSAAIAKAKGE